MGSIEDSVRALVPRERGGSLLAGLVAGLLAGAAAAALLSPRSGAATRELLRERGLELKDRAEAIGRGRRSPL